MEKSDIAKSGNVLNVVLNVANIQQNAGKKAGENKKARKANENGLFNYRELLKGKSKNDRRL